MGGDAGTAAIFAYRRNVLALFVKVPRNRGNASRYGDTVAVHRSNSDLSHRIVTSGNSFRMQPLQSFSKFHRQASGIKRARMSRIRGRSYTR